MKLTFIRTGGFGNIVVKVAIDSSTMVEEKANELQSMMDKTITLFSKEKVLAKPDMYHYSLTVENDGKEVSLEATDETASDDMHNLFTLILQEANKK